MPFDARQFFQFASDLRRAPAKVQQETGRAVRTSAEQLEKLAKGNAPHLTGDLEASIHATPINETEWRVGADIRYAGYVEFGTSRQAPQPYMGSAVDAVEEPFFTAVEAALGKGFG